MPALDLISAESPSWGFPLSKIAGLQRGEGSVYYRETYSFQGLWNFRVDLTIRMAGQTRHKTVGGNGFLVVPERLQENNFLHYGGVIASIRRKLRNPLQDGLCLFCGETDPFVFQYDHPLSWRNDEVFRITLCANCHHLKTAGRFWRLEQRLESWLGE